MDASRPHASKRQRIEHLEQREWVLSRPETYIGALEPTDVTILDFSGARVATKTAVLSPALLSLGKELFDNALDNCQRDDTQRYIKVQWKADERVLIVSNDGSTLPVEREPTTGEWAVTLAFGTFQSGSNFDAKETGRKETLYTSGRNGVGTKGCNVFSDRFVVRVVNSEDRKTFVQAWEANMSVVHAPKITTTSRKHNETCVEWTPDLARLGDPGTFMEDVCRWFSFNASLCAPPAVKVYFNGELVKLRSVEHFCRALGGTTPLATDTVEREGRTLLRLCVAARDTEAAVPDGAATSAAPGLTYAFVNGTPCNEGSHARYLFSKIGDILQAKAKSRRGGAKDLHATASFLQAHTVTVAVLYVERERFTDQRKRCLDAPLKDWGWRWEPSESFRSALERSVLPERLVAAAREKSDLEAMRATKATPRALAIAKYEPALRRHTAHATLIVCEGDSAGNLVRSGLTVVGRRDFGLYPLRGKFLNARGLSPKTILENKEALELLKILGIQLQTDYDVESVRKLPYARLMAMTDQDVDGSHIMGLLFNLIDVCAPSLLRHRPEYLCRFATSLIRVTLPRGGEEVGFYSQGEYDAWCEDRRQAGASLGVAKYFKGLGTSSAAQAKEYFRHLRENTITLVHGGPTSSDALDLAFNKKRTDDRKTFLTAHCDPSAHVDYSQSETTVEDFVHHELLPQYALASLRRAIPSLDGFKEALRKVFYGARSLKLTADLSVANAAGKISAHTNYHHRGTAMEDTIIGMAADYAGTSNINLLLPHGQFGTRHKHAAASAAYPKVCLNAPVHELLFPPVDDAVLDYVTDEGKRVEPTLYAPIIALPLVFGCKGIATGWSTDVPMFHPLDVVDATTAILDGTTPAEDMVPWYRGFSGTVTRVDATAFVVEGKGEWRGTEYHVTELPPFRETEAFREEWTNNTELVPGGVFPGDRLTDERVHFILKGLKRVDDPLQELGLRKKLALTNMHLLDETGTLKKYETPLAIVRDHVAFRRRIYERRLAFLRRRCERDVLIATNKARFIEACLSGEYDMRAHSNDVSAAEACMTLGLQPDPAEDDARDGVASGPTGLNFGYLLTLPYRSLTQERARRLIDEAETKRGELAALQGKCADELWKDDLAALREVLAADPRYAR